MEAVDVGSDQYRTGPPPPPTGGGVTSEPVCAPTATTLNLDSGMGSADLASAILAAPMLVAGAPPRAALSHSVEQPGTPARDEALLVPSNASSNDAVDEALYGHVGPDRQHCTPANYAPAGGGLAGPQPSGGAYRALAAQPRELEPCYQGDEEGRNGELIPDLDRPDDPRARGLRAAGGRLFELRPRLAEPLRVAAWGSSHNFQLGTGQYDAQRAPVLVDALDAIGGVVDLACAQPRPEAPPRPTRAPRVLLTHAVGGGRCGGDHCAAVDAEGRVYTWGLAERGRLGGHRNKDSPAPARVRALGECRAAAVACGLGTTACVSEAGQLYTWGAGSSGQLGHGDLGDEWIPRAVAALQHIRIVQVRRPRPPPHAGRTSLVAEHCGARGAAER